MSAVVATGLDEILGDEVVDARRRERRFPGAYDSWVLEVDLVSGRGLTLFVKDLSSCPNFKDDRQARRERELFVYRHVLAGTDLGTARFYGCTEDGLLVLEYVDGMPVRYCDIPDWFRAVRWLGRMQGTLAGRIGELRGSGTLPVRDDGLYWDMARRALRSVSEFSVEYERRLSTALRRWDLAVEAMSEGPHTLVHSAYRPAEILICDGAEGRRICPVDWELAAIGSTLFDFSIFTDGFEGEELDALLEAYRGEASRHGWDVPDGARTHFVIDCHRIYKSVTLLSHSAPRGYPHDAVEGILAGVERMAAETLG
jgi:hypothetical protein